MARRPSHDQQLILHRIESGEAITPRQTMAPDWEDLTVITYQWSWDGNSVVAHRTVLRPASERSADPRLNYRVEMFRISLGGDVSKL